MASLRVAGRLPTAHRPTLSLIACEHGNAATRHRDQLEAGAGEVPVLIHRRRTRLYSPAGRERHRKVSSLCCVSGLKSISSEAEDWRQFTPRLARYIESMLRLGVDELECALQADRADRTVVSVRLDRQGVPEGDLKHLVSADWELPRPFVCKRHDASARTPTLSRTPPRDLPRPAPRGHTGTAISSVAYAQPPPAGCRTAPETALPARSSPGPARSPARSHRAARQPDDPSSHPQERQPPLPGYGTLSTESPPVTFTARHVS